MWRKRNRKKKKGRGGCPPLCFSFSNNSLHLDAPQGRAFRPWSIGRWLEGHHPDPVEWGCPRLGPDETFSFLCPRDPVPPLWSLKVCRVDCQGIFETLH